jgi:hypothetical protein
VSVCHRCKTNDLGAHGCGVGPATVHRASSSLANSALLRFECRPGVAGAGAPGEGAGAQHVGQLGAAEWRQRRRLRLRGGAEHRYTFRDPSRGSSPSNRSTALVSVGTLIAGRLACISDSAALAAHDVLAWLQGALGSHRRCCRLRTRLTGGTLKRSAARAAAHRSPPCHSSSPAKGVCADQCIHYKGWKYSLAASLSEAVSKIRHIVMPE